ncbi:site-specific integrase [Pseudomonas amygdali]|uniref:site-specific integrase n=1 Tax=Pseudomonas amygdali TaxID=47877 RepID=UPI0006CD7906|nr:site-specific integrase [Pseudomonas amygdali]KPB59935.1 Uncharacterized protein AC510_0693 [Pseudomonas amygdali pv. myricae]RMT45382.1 hypothetical protein ALP46_200208 [Pseudomonas amygdali pv. myricae]RMV07067.1 hypothetical protein ALP18_00587 [Pseudomonas amygdali pv. myricae]RMV33329.1 hypothetical protein ALP14_01050 [Pseudomonas amygdali pv. myricae]
MIDHSLQPVKQHGFFTSRDGYYVDFDAERWVLSKDVSLAIGALSEIFPGDRIVLRRVLESYAKRMSPSHVKNLAERLSHYLKNLNGSPLFSVESLISYRASLGKKQEWYVGLVRIFVLQWNRLGYAGISADCLSLMDEWVIKGNEKGFAVQSMCPEEGPLSDIEMQGVINAITDAIASQGITLEQACIALTLSMTGRRSGQISALKIKDLISSEPGQYWLNFPRAKQRGTGWRAAFKMFPIVEDLWLLLQQHAQAVDASCSKILRPEVYKAVSGGELPLFPARRKITVATESFSIIKEDKTHLPSREIYKSMMVVSDVIRVVSERTAAPMNLNPNRFRYTLGTNLAREGRGVSVIAEALDHSDIQNVGVYVRNEPDIVERIDKAIALRLAPFAQAFRGVLVKSEKDALRGDDPRSRVNGVEGRDFVGTCGSYGWCGASPPLVCYTCTHFQPWLDGPHEAVLDNLISDRDRVHANTGDLKIASTNDRLILAVSEVVANCKAANGSD